MQKKWILIGFVLVFGVVWNAMAQTKPSGEQGGELMKPKGEMAGYGVEKYRVVSERDEIITILQSGMTVITKRVSSPVLAVRAYVRTGGVYEGKWLGGGLSHLLEHLVAGGSSQRRTEAQNRDLLQRIGNDSNAYTSEDHTAFFINTTKDHLDEATDLLSGWLLGALITPDEYRREYQVVQRELEMGKGEPDRQFWYMSMMNRYHVNPARVPVIGYQEVIQGLSRDDVYSYYKLAYVPSNMIFSIAGDLDPEVMLRAVQKYVEDAKPERVFDHNIAEEPPVLGPRTVVATAPKIGQAKLELGFPSIKLTHPDMYALDLLATVIGAGESSILTEDLRDQKHLVSSISAGDETPAYADGTFTIFMQLDPAKIDTATKEVLDLIEKIKKDGVDEEEIQRAKVQIKVGRVRSRMTSEGVASDLATNYMSTADAHFEDRYVDRINKVTGAQLKEMANKYLDRSRLLTTVMLPREFVGAVGLPKAEELLRPVAPTTKPGEEPAKAVVERIELPNGTIVLLKRMTTVPLVVMNMYSLGGLTEEDAKTNGLGNITMEMLPRGTKTRSAQQIAQTLDAIGAELGTAIGNNSWYWTASCLKENFDATFDVYADVVNNPSFPEDEIGPMKQRLIAGIDGQDASWQAQAFRFYKKSFFGPLNSPYQFITIGTKENVETFTRQQMSDWYDQKVKRSRRVMAIYGDIDSEHAKDLAGKYFGSGDKLNTAPPVTKAPPASGENTGDPMVDVERIEIQKTEQPLAGIVIGYEDQAVIGDADNWPMILADTMTSGYTYPTGYLHEILRGRGLVYVVHAMNQPGKDQKAPGSFIVYAGCDPSKVTEVINIILENIARVQGKPEEVNVDWFGRSKKLITTNDALQNETPEAQAAQAALDELYGLGYNYHEQFDAKINAVKLEEVRDIARKRLTRCVVTVSTPQPEQVKVEKGVKFYSSFAPVDLTPKGIQHDAGGAK